MISLHSLSSRESKESKKSNSDKKKGASNSQESRQARKSWQQLGLPNNSTTVTHGGEIPLTAMPGARACTITVQKNLDIDISMA